MVEVAAPVEDRCGEGAVRSAPDRAVFWTDINRFLVHGFDEDTSSTRAWIFDEPVVGLSLTTEPDRMLVILASELIWGWPAIDRRQDHGFRLEGYLRIRLNDGRANPYGNLWVGSMKNNVLPDGDLGEAGPVEGKPFRIAPDGSVTIWANDYAAGQITNRRDHFRGWDRCLPDGSATDPAGTLWNCRFGGACIARVSPDGTLKGTVDIGIPTVTTCVFGGEDLRTLDITSVTPPGHRLAGSLFSTRIKVPRLLENLMALP